MTTNRQCIRVSGKWILAGEHAVIRGHRAVALPRADLYLELQFTPSSTGGLIVSPPEAQAPLELLFRCLQQEELGFAPFLKHLQGDLSFQGNIPFGAGLGSSAALCVALARWLSTSFKVSPSWRGVEMGPYAPVADGRSLPPAATGAYGLLTFKPLSEMDIWQLATRLEDQFHGKSSGIDTATVCNGVPVGMRLTVREGESRPYPEIRRLGVQSLPRFTFHDTGIRSSTRACCEKVASLARQHPSHAERMDQQMDRAAFHAERGLIDYSNGERESGLQILRDSIRSAQDCFKQWGLVPPSVKDLEESLLRQGALAAKLIGSGDGGMMVALWPDLP